MASMEIKGIKCDNINCDYDDDTVKMEEYESYLGKPCPKCGNNLLTEADLKTVKQYMKLFNNPIFKGIDKVLGLFGSKETTVEVEMNGSGGVKLKECDDENR